MSYNFIYLLNELRKIDEGCPCYDYYFLIKGYDLDLRMFMAM